MPLQTWVGLIGEVSALFHQHITIVTREFKS